MDLEKETLIQVTNKLIGPIVPIGCSARDTARLENLKTHYSLTHALISNLVRVSEDRKAHGGSIKTAGNTAFQFLKDIRMITLEATMESGLDGIIDMIEGEDGESIEYIIEKIGMKDQILRQLIMSSDTERVKELLAEKEES